MAETQAHYLDLDGLSHLVETRLKNLSVASGGTFVGNALYFGSGSNVDPYLSVAPKYESNSALRLLGISGSSVYSIDLPLIDGGGSVLTTKSDAVDVPSYGEFQLLTGTTSGSGYVKLNEKPFNPTPYAVAGVEEINSGHARLKVKVTSTSSTTKCYIGFVNYSGTALTEEVLSRADFPSLNSSVYVDISFSIHDSSLETQYYVYSDENPRAPHRSVALNLSSEATRRVYIDIRSEGGTFQAFGELTVSSDKLSFA